MSQNKEMRINDDDLALIKGNFAGNEKLLKVLRKVFLPEITADAPIGQSVDLWMATKVEDMSPEQAVINIKARNMVIAHVEQQLMKLVNLAGEPQESVEATKKRLMQNSSK